MEYGYCFQNDSFQLMNDENIDSQSEPTALKSSSI